MNILQALQKANTKTFNDLTDALMINAPIGVTLLYNKYGLRFLAVFDHWAYDEITNENSSKYLGYTEHQICVCNDGKIFVITDGTDMLHEDRMTTETPNDLIAHACSELEEYIAAWLCQPVAKNNNRGKAVNDPTYEEMQETLKEPAEGDNHSVEEAIYWFCYEYHAGQYSSTHLALCSVVYVPDHRQRYVEQNSLAEVLYNILVEKYT